MSVTRTAVISTTKMTGLRISRRGSSLRKASREGGPQQRRVEDAARARAASPPGFAAAAGSEALEAARAAREVDADRGSSHQKAFPASWRSCSTIGPRASAGK